MGFKVFVMRFSFWFSFLFLLCPSMWKALKKVSGILWEKSQEAILGLTLHLGESVYSSPGTSHKHIGRISTYAGCTDHWGLFPDHTPEHQNAALLPSGWTS